MSEEKPLYSYISDREEFQQPPLRYHFIEDHPPIVPSHQHGPFHVRAVANEEQIMVVRWCEECGKAWTMSQAVGIIDGQTRYHLWNEVREAPEPVEE